MTETVVVVTSEALSERQVDQIDRLFESGGRSVRYELLLISPQRSDDGRLSYLGVERADTFGSAATAQRAGAGLTTGQDPAELMTVSAGRLRRTGHAVEISIGHGDPLESARNLVETTGSRRIVLVGGIGNPIAGSADRQTQATELLRVDRIDLV